MKAENKLIHCPKHELRIIRIVYRDGHVIEQKCPECELESKT